MRTARRGRVRAGLAAFVVAAGCAVLEQPPPSIEGVAPRAAAPRPTVSDERGGELSGTASVIDGDTIEVDGEHVRLHGIDAPEANQTCDLDGTAWRCGQASANALALHIGRHPVICSPRTRDRYGRVVAACGLGGADIAAWMAREGWALAYRRYTDEYVADERAARAARRGIWRSTFVPPWEWRARRRARGGTVVPPQTPSPSTSSDDHPQGCDVKGNINRKGQHIYHLPGSRSYSTTSIDPGRGERWFCSEAEAQAAGWRRAR
jgi:endonuclease YncB( thermonuclease family)